MRRWPVRDGTRKDELQRPGPAVLVRGEALGEECGAFAVVDAAQAQQERSVVETERDAGRRGVAVAGVGAEADHCRGLLRDREPRLHECPLWLAPVAERSRVLEEIGVHRESQRWFVVGGRMQHRSVAYASKAGDGRVIQVRVKGDRVCIRRRDGID